MSRIKKNFPVNVAFKVEGIAGETGTWVRVGPQMLTTSDALLLAQRLIEAVKWTEQTQEEVTGAQKSN